MFAFWILFRISCRVNLTLNNNNNDDDDDDNNNNNNYLVIIFYLSTNYLFHIFYTTSYMYNIFLNHSKTNLTLSFPHVCIIREVIRSAFSRSLVVDFTVVV